MSLKWKILLSVFVAESLILAASVFVSLNYVSAHIEEELSGRASHIERLFHVMAGDARSVNNVDHLDRFLGEVLKLPDVVYARVLGNSGVILAEGGRAASLSAEIVPDKQLAGVVDGVFDSSVDIVMGDEVSGRIQFGLAVERFQKSQEEARLYIGGLAAIGVLVSVFLAGLLAGYLRLQLRRVEAGIERVAAGEIGHQIDASQGGEIGRTSSAFNNMSVRVKELYDDIHLEKSRLHTVMETVSDGIIVINDSGVMRSCNPAACKMFGYQPSEMIGHNVKMLMTSAEAERHDGYIRGYMQMGDKHVIGRTREQVGLRKNNSTFPLSLTVNALMLKTGPMFVGILHDLSEARTTAEKLRKSQKLQAGILATALDCIITIDDKSRVVEFNPAAERTFGYKYEEILGRSLADFIVPERFREAHARGMAHYLKTGEHEVLGQRVELIALHRDGHEFPVEIAVTPVELEGARLFTAYLRDISDRKRAEEELRKAQREAEAASQAKSNFLAVMSHEIRTPMNAILGSLSILDETKLSAEQRRFLDNAEQAGKGMVWLINDILDFSKIEAGKLKLELNEVDLVSLVEETIDLMVVRARDKNIELGFHFDSTLPARVLGDSGRLRQIILNLVSNAVKFTEDGGVLISVRDSKEGGMVLRVSDTGIGISKEKQHFLFKEFVQADSVYSRKYGGTGLGLAISGRLVKMMGGEIGVSSEQGKGSCFMFKIPLQPVEEALPIECPEGLPEKVRLSVANPVTRTALARQLVAWNVMVEGSDSQDGNDAYMEVFGEDGIGRKIHLTNATVSCGQSQLEIPVKYELLAKALRGEDLNLAAENNVNQQEGGVVNTAARRILLAEDSHANQMVAVAMLESGGYEVDAVANGQEAVHAFNNLPYDLVLMDLSMPEMDGIEATKEIRLAEGEGKRTPILAMTANVVKGDLKRCMASGMDDYITKPVRKEDLLNIVSRWLPKGDKNTVPTTQEEDVRVDHDKTYIDENVLAQLLEDTGATVVPVMMEVYFAETRDHLQRLSELATQPDLSEMQREAHALKSSSGTMGAVALQQGAKALEEACKANDDKCAVALVEQLQRVGRESIGQLAQRFAIPQQA